MKERLNSRTKRRMLYAGTMVAVLAMVGGFAMASITLGNTSITSTQGGNGTTLSASAWTASKIYSGYNGTSACGTAVSITSATAASGYVAGTSSACASGDLTEEIVYSASVPAGTSGTVLKDTFEVYSSTGATPALVTNPISISVTESGTAYTATVDLIVDYGTTSSIQIDSLSVSINGAL